MATSHAHFSSIANLNWAAFVNIYGYLHRGHDNQALIQPTKHGDNTNTVARYVNEQQIRFLIQQLQPQRIFRCVYMYVYTVLYIFFWVPTIYG